MNYKKDIEASYTCAAKCIACTHDTERWRCTKRLGCPGFKQIENKPFTQLEIKFE